MTHTPEPWTVRETASRVDSDITTETVGADGRTVCCDTSYYPTHVEPDDQRRIAACVNACAGIPTDKLRPGIVKECREAMHGMLDDYLDMSPLSTRQRAAVEKMIVLLRELGEP